MKSSFSKKVLLCFMIISMMSVNVFAATSSVDSLYDQSSNSLLNLGVVSKTEAKTFKVSKSITKVQFLKMVVIAMGKNQEAQSSKKSTIFSDVTSSNIYSGYINVAVKNKIISGYSDGTFRPNEELTYSQALIILVKALGYESADVPGVWPKNFIDKAKDIEITKDMNIKPDSKLIKRDAIILVYRTLNTKAKNSDKTLGEVGGFGTSKTAIIINSSDLDKSIPKNIVKTDIGDFKATDFKGENYLGKKINLLVDKNNNIIAVQDLVGDGTAVFVNTIVGNKISYSDKDGSNTLDVPDNMTFYYKGLKQTFKDIKINVVQGSMISLGIDRDTNQYGYGVLVDPTMSDPVIVLKDIKINDKSIGQIDISNKDVYTVIKNGQLSSFSNIKMFDVVYEVKNPFKQGGILLVYDNKVTGVYEEALPNKNAVSKITIDGKQYEVENAYAASKLNDADGAFKIDDKITILTGSSGKIVDVISPNALNVSDLAVIINTRKTNNTTGTQFYYSKLYKSDGTTAEYQTANDNAYLKGKIVKFELSGDIATIIPFTYSPMFGKLDRSTKMIDNAWMTENPVLLDINNTGDSQDVSVKQLKLQDLPDYIPSDKVIHSEMGGPFGDIQLMAFSNITQATQYGLLTSKTQTQSLNYKMVGGIQTPVYTIRTSYSLQMDGKTVSYNNTDTAFNVNQGDIVYIDSDSRGLNSMYTLSTVDTGSSIQAIDSRRIKINNKVYRLAYNVQVYDLSTSTSVQMSAANLNSGEVKMVALYGGLQYNQDKLIRAITIIKK